MQIIITGDSHSAVLKKGMDHLEAKQAWPADINLTIRPLGSGQSFPTRFFIDRGDYAEIVDEEYCKRFKRLPLLEESGIEIVYGFSASFHTVRVWRSGDWESFAPFPVAEQEIPVSAAMLRRVILDDQKYVLALMDILIRAGKRVFAIESPRPFRHHKALIRTREKVVCHIDSEYRKLLREELARRSIPVVSIPSQCVDEDGFMLDSYRNNREGEMNHSNKAFGSLMMLELLDCLSNWPEQQLRPKGQTNNAL